MSSFGLAPTDITGMGSGTRCSGIFRIGLSLLALGGGTLAPRDASAWVFRRGLGLLYFCVAAYVQHIASGATGYQVNALRNG